MSGLKEIIHDEIRRDGPIPFSRFMELCLYHPQKGYYRKNFLPIGKSGDFYTSPCVHKLFGHILAKQIKELIELISDDEISIIEAGAGRGHLARDIGEYFKLYEKALQKKINLIIIEPHIPFRDIQYKELKDFYNKVEFAGLPDNLPVLSGVFYSNELFDAFPVEVLVKEHGELKQIYIDCDGKVFFEKKDAVTDEVSAFLKEYSIEIPDNFRTEIAPSITGFYRKALNKIKTGASLTIDYGYSQKEYLSERRNRGTLMGYYRHTAVDDPYIRAGEQDLTAHVNFSILKSLGEAEGFFTAGYTEQEYFLMGAGFIEEAERLKANLSAAEYENEIKKAKTLVMPGGMGSIFKVLLQEKGLNRKDFSGFKFRNNLKAL